MRRPGSATRPPAATVLATALLWAAVLAPALSVHAQQSDAQQAQGDAQQADDPGWSISGELSFVQTGGNAQSSTLGLATTLGRSWEPAELKIEAGGIRTRTTQVDRTARGAADAYRIEERSESRVSAENYYVRLRLDFALSRRSAIFAKSDWTRNTFSGVAARYVAAAGLSTRWIQGEAWRLRTGYAATYTFQEDVVANPETRDDFVGLQLSADHSLQLTDNSEWTSTLVLDGNGLELSDMRADWTNALSIAMNDNLGLKTTVRLLFDNRPSLAGVPLVSSAGEPAGTVFVARRKLDRVATLALVVTL